MVFHPGVETAPAWESRNQVQVLVVLLSSPVTRLEHISFCPFGLGFSVYTVCGGGRRGGMDSTLMFRDALESFSVVLQLVPGDKVHPERVFKESAEVLCLR